MPDWFTVKGSGLWSINSRCSKINRDLHITWLMTLLAQLRLVWLLKTVDPFCCFTREPWALSTRHHHHHHGPENPLQGRAKKNKMLFSQAGTFNGTKTWAKCWFTRPVHFRPSCLGQRDCHRMTLMMMVISKPYGIPTFSVWFAWSYYAFDSTLPSILAVI